MFSGQPTQADSAIKEQMPLSLGRLINGAPTILIRDDTRRRAPASPGDLLGAVSLGAVMENMWLVAQLWTSVSRY